MKTSAGLILTDGENILLGHATLSTRWDIPKGEIEKDESALQTVIRETQEETGIKIKNSNLENLGLFRYLSNKKLHLFKYNTDKMPKINQLKCNSFFERYGKQYPEFDKFKIVQIKNIQRYVSKNLFNTLEPILNSKT